MVTYEFVFGAEFVEFLEEVLVFMEENDVLEEVLDQVKVIQAIRRRIHLLYQRQNDLREVRSYKLILSKITQPLKRKFQETLYMDMEVLFKLIEGVQELQFIVCIVDHCYQVLRQDFRKVLLVFLVAEEWDDKLLQTHIRADPYIDQHMPEEHIDVGGHDVQEVNRYLNVGEDFQKSNEFLLVVLVSFGIM